MLMMVMSHAQVGGCVRKPTAELLLLLLVLIKLMLLMLLLQLIRLGRVVGWMKRLLLLLLLLQMVLLGTNETHAW